MNKIDKMVMVYRAYKRTGFNSGEDRYIQYGRWCHIMGLYETETLTRASR